MRGPDGSQLRGEQEGMRETQTQILCPLLQGQPMSSRCHRKPDIHRKACAHLMDVQGVSDLSTPPAGKRGKCGLTTVRTSCYRLVDVCLNCVG